MNTSTTLALRRSDKLFLIILAVLLGGGLGFLLPLIWNGIKSLTWLPFHEPLSFFMSIETPYMLYLRPLTLVALGLGIVTWLILVSPVVEVTPKEIQIKKGNDRRTIKRRDVAGIYHEGSKVVIETEKGRRLFADTIEGGKERIEKVFIEYGYPWES